MMGFKCNDESLSSMNRAFRASGVVGGGSVVCLGPPRPGKAEGSGAGRVQLACRPVYQRGCEAQGEGSARQE